jgi:hypothetical protein
VKNYGNYYEYYYCDVRCHEYDLQAIKGERNRNQKIKNKFKRPREIYSTEFP